MHYVQMQSLICVTPLFQGGGFFYIFVSILKKTLLQGMYVVHHITHHTCRWGRTCLVKSQNLWGIDLIINAIGKKLPSLCYQLHFKDKCWETWNDRPCVSFQKDPWSTETTEWPEDNDEYRTCHSVTPPKERKQGTTRRVKQQQKTQHRAMYLENNRG